MKKVEQHWKVQVVKDNPTYPFIVIDNWYTPQEEKNIWKELDWYSSHEQIDRAEDTIVARYSDGTSMSKAYRFYTGDYYSDTGYNKSHVANYMYKQRTPEFHKIIGECMPYARSFMTSNKDSTLISY